MRAPYDVVMDANKNPLRALPKVQRYQIMVVLSIMWVHDFLRGDRLLVLVGRAGCWSRCCGNRRSHYRINVPRGA